MGPDHRISDLLRWDSIDIGPVRYVSSSGQPAEPRRAPVCKNEQRISPACCRCLHEKRSRRREERDKQCDPGDPRVQQKALSEEIEDDAGTEEAVKTGEGPEIKICAGLAVATGKTPRNHEAR